MLCPCHYQCNDVEEDIHTSYEENERKYFECGAKSELNHLRKSFLSGIHVRLLSGSSSQQRLILEGIIHILIFWSHIHWLPLSIISILVILIVIVVAVVFA
jgi:hypothetical protein